MNQQWLTTLISNVKSQVSNQLGAKGVKLNSADLAALLEELSPTASNAAMSYAIDLLRPFSAGMGLRVAKLSDQQIELVLPNRTRNKNAAGFLHEAALVAASTEAARMLWERHAPMGKLDIQMQKVQLHVLKQTSEQVRVRTEMTESVREVNLANLRQVQMSQLEMSVQIFDENEQAIADVQMFVELKFTPSLSAQQNS